MLKKFFIATLALLLHAYSLLGSASNEIPVSYQGRLRPFEAYARLWLFDYYHREQISQTELSSFKTSDSSPETLLWKIHFLGHQAWEEAPLFFIQSAKLKSLLGLNLKEHRFSYRHLTLDKELPFPLMKELVLHFYFKNATENGNQNSRIELIELSAGLRGALRGNSLVIAEASDHPPWNALKTGTLIADHISSPETYLTHAYKGLANDALTLLRKIRNFKRMEREDSQNDNDYRNAYLSLKERGLPPKEIAIILDSQFPLLARLADAGQEMLLLPSGLISGEWYSPRAFKTKVYDPAVNELKLVSNFTVYPDSTFHELRQLYFQIQKSMEERNEWESKISIQRFSERLHDAYRDLEGKPYSTAHKKKLRYPTSWQLKAETFYYRLPLIEICIGLYAIAALTLTLTRGMFRKTGVLLLTIALFVHTVVLAMRCYVLDRPPVSNMFETVIYVPWVAVVVSVVFAIFFKNTLVMAASALLSLVLLIILKLTNLNSGLENVQAVLDSQFWLIIHVLMVVGSYGLFALAGILGHLYLIQSMLKGSESDEMKSIARLVLQSVYLGTTLLIPGTILGGVWAAESWGRFWDWDPKESWAFISSSVYLMWIHAHRFNHIGNFGLAVGSIVGLLAISFTWYGVNYILGTGLHSYGFGSGGELYYYFFLIGETIFLGAALKAAEKRNRKVVLK